MSDNAPPPPQQPDGSTPPPPDGSAPPPPATGGTPADAKAQRAAERAYAKASRPWYRKKRFLVPLGLILLVAVGSSLGGEDATTPDGASDSAATRTAPATGSETDEPAPTTGIGAPARDGSFEFTLSSVDCGQSTVGGEFIQEEAQGQFCLLEVSVTNIGDEAQFLFADNQYLYDGQDRRFSADSAATFATDPDNGLLLDEINPGNNLTGTIVFDVPADATPVRAELHDSAFSSGVEIDLGG